jgi:hypothetical protein
MTDKHKKMRFIGALDAKYFDTSAKGTIALTEKIHKVVEGKEPPFGPPLPHPVSFLDPEEYADSTDCLVVFLLDEERGVVSVARAPRLTDVSAH